MRRERERELVINFEISKILACRVEKKKVEDFFYRGDKRLPRQAANPPSPPDFVCTHERHTHTYTRIIIARFIEARSRENLCTGSASFTLT